MSFYISDNKLPFKYTNAAIIPINTVIFDFDLQEVKGSGLALQISALGTTGVLTPEFSSDEVTWVSGWCESTVLGSVNQATITAVGLYSIPRLSRFIRLRMSTATTAGTTTLSLTESCTDFRTATASGSTVVSGTIAATQSGAFTVSKVANARITDVVSAALTASNTTAAITPTLGIGYQVHIAVTAVTGTLPTLDTSIEESYDDGTNWIKVYDFPRITVAGFYLSPMIPFTGTRLRYVQTVGGTTPSFTRSVGRIQSQQPAIPVRQLIDRTIVLNTLNSVTPSLDAREAGNQVKLVFSTAAGATTQPALQLEGSEDNGATWVAIGAPLTAVAGATVSLNNSGQSWGLVRARVSTAGVAAVANYTLIKAHD